MRDPLPTDFASALKAFALRVVRPKVHLSIAQLPDGLGRRASHTLLRCAQEIITNTLRHADAGNLWIETAVAGSAYELQARDDGCGQHELRRGNGLTGITERIQEMKGLASFETGPQRGFRVTIRLPIESGEAR